MSKDSEKGKYSTPDGVATWEYVSAACCALLVFSSSSVFSWIAPTLNILIKPESPIPTTAEQGSSIAGAVTVGYMLAPIISILIVDRIGRKNSLVVGTVPIIAGWSIAVIAKDVTLLIVSTFSSGFGMGLIISIVPIYLGEISSVKLRGALGMICSTMVNTATVFMFVVAPHTSIQVMASISLSIIIVLTIMTWFIPESPCFLAMRGRFEEAEISLEKLRGKTDVTEELDLIKATLRQNEKALEGGGKEEERITSAVKLLFTVPANRRSLLISVLMSTSISCGGYMIATFYCTMLFEAMNAPISPNTSMVVTGLLQLSSNILTTFVIERFGRRPLLRISGAVSGTCLSIVASYFYLLEHTEIDVAPYSIHALCAFFVNLIAINVGLMPLQMVIQSEIIATEVKALSCGIVTVIGGLSMTVSVKFYILIAITLEFGHSIPFFSLAVVTWLCTFFILKLLPETKGKTLLEIQSSLR